MYSEGSSVALLLCLQFCITCSSPVCETAGKEVTYACQWMRPLTYWYVHNCDDVLHTASGQDLISETSVHIDPLQVPSALTLVVWWWGLLWRGTSLSKTFCPNTSASGWGYTHCQSLASNLIFYLPISFICLVVEPQFGVHWWMWFFMYMLYMLTKLCFSWATFISRSSHCTMFDCLERAKMDAASNQKTGWCWKPGASYRLTAAGYIVYDIDR